MIGKFLKQTPVVAALVLLGVLLVGKLWYESTKQVYTEVARSRVKRLTLSSDPSRTRLSLGVASSDGVVIGLGHDERPSIRIGGKVVATYDPTLNLLTIEPGWTAEGVIIGLMKTMTASLTHDPMR